MSKLNGLIILLQNKQVLELSRTN